MNTKLLTGGGMVLAVVLLLTVNIASQGTLHSLRLDLTENNLYTLSDGTRNILSNLEEPITLRLFLSQQLATRLPGISGYATRVSELLKEFKRAADPNIRLSIIDPEPFSEEEDRAVGYGLQGVPLGDGESTFYFGLVATGPTDEEEVIAFLSPEREEFLEYDVAKLVHQVAYPKPVVVGLMTSVPMDGVDPAAAAAGMRRTLPRPWFVLEQMQQLFEVKKLETDIETISEDVDVLMLVHPKELADKTLYAIDQFVLNGGRALVFVDPHAESDSAGGFPGAGSGPSNIGRLLRAWGLDFNTSKVLADLQLAERVQFSRQARPVVVDYPVWMKVPPELLNEEDIVTGKLGSITLATPGRLIPLEDATTKIETLIRTTPTATEIDVTRVSLVTDPQDLLRDYRPAGESFIMGARITGKVKTAFADGPPPTDDAEKDESTAEEKATSEAETTGDDDEKSMPKTEREHLSESKEAVNLIVIADSDLLQDRFWVQVQNLLGTRIALPTAANGSLVVNALDNLTGSNDLISVRNRGHFSRPFTLVDEIRQEAELRFREKEQQLLNRLKETERNLLELERGKGEGDALVLSEAQQREIERFRQEKIRLRKDLRQVRHELRRNIENLESWVKFINIGLVPLLIAVGGILIAVHRVRQRKSPLKSTVQTA